MPPATARRSFVPLPWRDYSGQLSPLKAATFAALFIPFVINAGDYAFGQLGARPITELIHASGLWTIRLLFLSLAVTPLCQILRMPRLILVRRMIGVAAFAYAAIHLSMDVVDKNFDLRLVVSEIIHRYYLAIGLTALTLLAALAVTSTDGMQRRLGGRRWQNLHRVIYLIALLASVHFFMQSKIDKTEATVMAGLYLWLMGYRLLFWYGGARLAAARFAVVALCVGAGLLTALGEAACYGLFTGIDPRLVLEADLGIAAGLRPGWTVLAITAFVFAAALARDLWQSRPTPRPARP